MTLPSADSDRDLNGLILSNIPEEVLGLILSYVDPDSLVFLCRPVCKLWKNLIDEDVWKIRIRTSKQRSFSKLSHAERMTLKLPWYIYYSIFTGDPFERNLMKNHCGQDKMNHWFEFKERSIPQQPIVMRQPRLGNAFWKIETVPEGGSDPLPEHNDFGNCTTCFVNSFRLEGKYQIIDLKSHRISQKIMDKFQPTITASEWNAGKSDYEYEYQLTVRLLDEHKNVLLEKQSPVKVLIEQWKGKAWKKVELIFDNYGPGVRYIKFIHEGRDTQCWSGHYGSKMSGAVVKISLPAPKTSDFCQTLKIFQRT
ncbi:F-box only protein 6-like [Planococcus citri]|uniref:F-box only protein 6-like n=1 Tax=Planococcus citri TaxID=170843 RepID=UPI0031F96137